MNSHYPVEAVNSGASNNTFNLNINIGEAVRLFEKFRSFDREDHDVYNTCHWRCRMRHDY